MPNCEDINIQKYNFYSWLHFLDVVLCALTVTAALHVLSLDSIDDVHSQTSSITTLIHIATKIVDTFLLPSIDCLEADGVKRLHSNTVLGYAVLLMHNLMTLHEMRHSIKHSHPTWLLHMLEYWTSMFYAGESYNYAHECMELLHNVKHDWPSNAASVLSAVLLVNTTGKPDGFKKGNLNVEYLNKDIKLRV